MDFDLGTYSKKGSNPKLRLVLNTAFLLAYTR
jgi:hypothetical protein